MWGSVTVIPQTCLLLLKKSSRPSLPLISFPSTTATFRVEGLRQRQKVRSRCTNKLTYMESATLQKPLRYRNARCGSHRERCCAQYRYWWCHKRREECNWRRLFDHFGGMTMHMQSLAEVCIAANRAKGTATGAAKQPVKTSKPTSIILPSVNMTQGLFVSSVSEFTVYVCIYI